MVITKWTKKSVSTLNWLHLYTVDEERKNECFLLCSICQYLCRSNYFLVHSCSCFGDFTCVSSVLRPESDNCASRICISKNSQRGNPHYTITVIQIFINCHSKTMVNPGKEKVFTLYSLNDACNNLLKCYTRASSRWM